MFLLTKIQADTLARFCESIADITRITRNDGKVIVAVTPLTRGDFDTMIVSAITRTISAMLATE